MLRLVEPYPHERMALKGGPKEHNAHVHRRDGHEEGLAISPPAPRRGLVLIEPSCEVKAEYFRIADLVIALHGKWPQTTVMVWLPILAAGLYEPMVAHWGVEQDLKGVEEC